MTYAGYMNRLTQQQFASIKYLLSFITFIACLSYILLFRVTYQSRYRSTFIAIAVVIMLVVKLCSPAPPVTTWSKIRTGIVNITFTLTTISSLIVVCIIQTEKSESRDMLLLNLMLACPLSFMLWLDWRWKDDIGSSDTTSITHSNNHQGAGGDVEASVPPATEMTSAYGGGAISGTSKETKISSYNETKVASITNPLINNNDVVNDARNPAYTKDDINDNNYMGAKYFRRSLRYRLLCQLCTSVGNFFSRVTTLCFHECKCCRRSLRFKLLQDVCSSSCKILKQVGRVLLEVLVLLLLCSISYGAISRIYNYVNRYNTLDRTVVTVNATTTSLAAICFCNGGQQSLFEHCYSVQPSYEKRRIYLLETGLGAVLEFYTQFMQDLSVADSRAIVCGISRRGNSWSDPMSVNDINNPFLPIDTCHYVAQWVHVKGIKEPVNLIGHSYGGFHIAAFAMQYPQLTQSLLFIESSTFLFGLQPKYPAIESESTIQLLQLAAQLFGLEGLPALVADLGFLPRFVVGTDLENLTPALMNGMVMEYLHTQMVETITRDETNISVAYQAASDLCHGFGTAPVSIHAPALWVSAFGAYPYQYACLPVNHTTIVTKSIPSTHVRIFIDARAQVIDEVMTFMGSNFSYHPSMSMQ